MTENPTPYWKHALLGFLYGAVFGCVVLAGGHTSHGQTPTLILPLAAFIPILFACLAGIYRNEFWERALLKNRETRRRTLGWVLGIILILLMFRFMS